jgi:hypothetical protein
MPGGINKKLKSSEVKDVKASNESMMPALWESMSKQQLADLLEYLEGLKKS